MFVQAFSPDCDEYLKEIDAAHVKAVGLPSSARASDRLGELRDRAALVHKSALVSKTV